MKIQKIYVVGALHGNEVFALKVIGQLEMLGHPYIITRVGNPEAIAKKKSFIESDLNRSFGVFGRNTQEARLAKSIVTDIARHQPNLIIDVHSAVAKIGKVSILASDDPALLKISELLGMDQAAIMPPSIHHVSLIGQYPHTSLSLDFGKDLRSDGLARQIASNIAALIGQEVIGPAPTNLPVYLVRRMIQPEEAAPEELENYVFNKKLQGYPFIASATGYKDYRGFLAVKKEA